MKTDFNISDDDDQEETAELEEGEVVEEEEEGDETKPGTAAHKRARGDEGGEDEEEPTAEELEAIAGNGKRANSLKERLSTVTKDRDRAIDVSLKLAEKLAAAEKPAAKKEEPPAYDYAAKEKEVSTMRREARKALLEGDEDKAEEIESRMDALQKEINRKQREQDISAAEARANQRIASALEEDRMEKAIAAGFEKFPFLDTENKDVEHNAEALEDVVMYRDRYIKSGDAPSTALRKAIAKVGPMYAEVEEEEVEEDEEPGSKVDTSIRERLRQRRLKNARAEKRQPPQTSKLGIAHRDRIDPATLDIENMSDKEWDALPDDVKKKLRGDRISA